MMRLVSILFFVALSGCGGLAWNTTVADHPQVRSAMLSSIEPGATTEKRFVAQWGMPTQKIREGAQVSYVYRNMSNPKGFIAPQFGNSAHFVVAVFQYGLAIGGYSSDTQGCRATFAPRPPGPHLDNPSNVHAVNCNVIYDGSTEKHPLAAGLNWLGEQARKVNGGPPQAPTSTKPGVPADVYTGGKYN